MNDKISLINGNNDIEENDNFVLHQCIFEGDIEKLSLILKTFKDISIKDHHECVKELIAHKAEVKLKNNQGWTPLDEALSIGDRSTVMLLLRTLKRQAHDEMERRQPIMLDALVKLGDFYMEMVWHFKSWVPLISRMLPNDTCKIYKKGKCIRVDTTLVEFKNMKCERGDVSFIFNGNKKKDKSLYILDNVLKVYHKFKNEEFNMKLEDDVDLLMASDIISAVTHSKNISFSRTQSGWINKINRSEMIGNFMADFYVMDGLRVETKKRREHLSEEDIRKNKALQVSLTKANIQPFDDQITHRSSLPSPTRNRITWKEYAESETIPELGRPIKCKINTKSLSATIAVSQNFPMSTETLADVLEIFKPFKQLSKLRSFLQNKLPQGFPVKLEIPVFPAISAEVTFQEFQWCTDICDSKFSIPCDYTKNSQRFSQL